MKKLNLKLGGIKEMLSKEQMKKITGGEDYADHCDEGLIHCDCHVCTDEETGCDYACSH